MRPVPGIASCKAFLTTACICPFAEHATRQARGHSLRGGVLMDKRVVVIGAGFAGLAAAKSLKELSTAKVTVLEAGNYIGGRAKSALLSDGQKKVELGATWLHGTQGHPVFQLAQQYGLMSPNETAGTNFWKGARYVREGEHEALADEEAQVASLAISTFAETVDEVNEGDAGTVGQHLRAQFQQLYAKTEVGSRERDILTDAWGLREQLQRGIDGSDCTDDSSAAGLAEYEDLPGAWPPVTGGYQAVAACMAEELEDVRVNCAVDRITWGSDGVKIRLQNGQELEADAVIVTVSLGVLKERHRELFQPPLPERKVAAIQRLGIGVVDKIFVVFDPQAMGHPSHYARCYELLWRRNATDLLPGAERSLGKSAIECCFSAPEISSDTAVIKWQQGIYALRLGGSEFIKGRTPSSDAAQVKTQVLGVGGADGAAECDGAEAREQPVGTSAVAWISSHCAVKMEQASEQQVHDGITALLDAFPAADLPRTFKVVRTTWGMNPFTRGSYSYIAAGASNDDVDTLAEPLTVERKGQQIPVVCFAGEATHRKNIGTTAGAYFSGVREAQRLIAALGIEKHSYDNTN